MSEEDGKPLTGPTMLAATNMLKPPPAVIGSINKDINLPRTIKLTTLAVSGAGVVLGFLMSLAVLGPGIDALIYGPLIGGAVGWGLANYSPLQGESFARWLGLQAGDVRKRKLQVDGRPVRLYVGIAPLHRTAAGTVRIVPGGVPVEGTEWDGRGVPKAGIPGAQRLPGAPRNARGSRGRRLKASTNLTGKRGLRGRKAARSK